MVEQARAPIDRGAVQALGKVQNTGQRVFSHRQRIARTSRGCHYHAAAPQIAHEQIAGARRALMKPFQPRCPRAQIERKWPATKDNFSFGEEEIEDIFEAVPIIVLYEVGILVAAILERRDARRAKRATRTDASARTSPPSGPLVPPVS